MKPQPRYQSGDKIGDRYLVKQALMGGMGEVYLCLDLLPLLSSPMIPQAIMPYALKTFQPRYNTPKLRELFFEEVNVWMGLGKHANVVQCFHMDTLDGHPFMFLEWVIGTDKEVSLRNWLRRGPIDVRIALDFAIDICRGLVYANAKYPGIVHRDLKPDNVLVDSLRFAKITDFGLASIVQRSEIIAGDLAEDSVYNTLHRERGIVGTPMYMSPEQWRGEELDGRADIYAIGCVLYEMLTGEYAFKDATIAAVRTAHCQGPVPSLQPNYRWLMPILECCLAKNRTERFDNCNNLLLELERAYQAHFDIFPREEVCPKSLTSMEYYNRGVTYGRLGRYEEAKADYDSAIEISPDIGQFYSSRGSVYGRLGRTIEALADYDRAIEISPLLAEAYAGRGSQYHKMGQMIEALADFNYAIELDPTCARAFFGRGTLRDNLGGYSEALADVTRAIRLDPSDTEFYVNRGAIFEKLGKYADALADYSVAIELELAVDKAEAYYKSSVAKAYYNRGNIFIKLKQYDEALADYSCAIDTDRTYAQPYYNRGTTYLILGQETEALADLNLAIELEPTYTQAYNNLGAILVNRGEFEQALPYFERAAQLGHPNAAQNAYRLRQHLGLAEPASQKSTDQLMIAFMGAPSHSEMQKAVDKFPFMTDIRFLRAIEQHIAQYSTPKDQALLRQRFTLLQQIANKVF